MIKKLLDFSSEYDAKVSMTKEMIIKSPTFTDARKDIISRNVEHIETIYDIRYKNNNSQMLVVVADINNSDGKYTEIEVAQTIASGIPCYCMVIVKNHNAAFILSFDERPNTKFKGRMLINKTYKSIKINLVSPSDLSIELAKELRDSISKADSAEKLSMLWKECIIQNGRKHYEEINKRNRFPRSLEEMIIQNIEFDLMMKNFELDDILDEFEDKRNEDNLSSLYFDEDDEDDYD